MPFQLSPGVNVAEADLSSIIPAVSTSVGAFAGKFAWGPIEKPVRVAKETELAKLFGRPVDANSADFFTAASFLAYSNNLLVARADAAQLTNAVAIASASVHEVTLAAAGLYHGPVTATVSAPDIVSGTTATLNVQLTGAGIQSFTVTNPGSGYTVAPTVQVTSAQGDAGFGATGIAKLSGSGVQAVNLVDGGTTYSMVGTTLTFSDPEVSGGQRAVATFTLDGNGTITSITITNAGSGYLNAPTITITGDGSGASATATIGKSSIASITLSNPGQQYVATPTVMLVGGDGTGAAATAVVSDSPISSVTIATAGAGYTRNPTVTITGAGAGGGVIQVTLNPLVGVKVKNLEHYQANYESGEGTVGEFAAKYPGTIGNSIGVSMVDANGFSTWAYKTQFSSAPGTSAWAANHASSNDELHIVVIDTLGAWTGLAGSVLEKFAFVSKASDAKSYNNLTSYYKAVLNGQSRYVWWMDHPAANTDWGQAAQGVTFSALTGALTRNLVGGINDWNSVEADLENAWVIFSDDTQYDISLVPVGAADPELISYIQQNVVEARKDCVFFASAADPESGDPIMDSDTSAADTAVTFRNALGSTSYGSLDSGYKYMYDKYNDKYRWIPLNGDTAGLYARTDATNDPWYPAAGFNRGQVKNAVKLAMNPRQTMRDVLYPAQINPVVSFPGQGIVLYGNKTLQAKASAFDRVNVRRLFIVLEKAIATAAKYSLFELNTPFTQAQFTNMVTPFLRDVMGRQGITDFRVICDSSNNTPDIVANHQFVADIYIKPSYSIEFIQLNFNASGPEVDFTEIGG